VQQDDKYLALLRTYWKRDSAFPSMVKLCAMVRLSSTSSIFALVGRLVEAGYLGTHFCQRHTTSIAMC